LLLSGSDEEDGEPPPETLSGGGFMGAEGLAGPETPDGGGGAVEVPSEEPDASSAWGMVNDELHPGHVTELPAREGSASN